MNALFVFLPIHYKNTDTGFSEQFKSWKRRSIKMNNPNKKEDKSSYAIGGGVLIGLGIGIFYIRIYPLGIVAFTLMGIGLGLLVAAIISRK